MSSYLVRVAQVLLAEVEQHPNHFELKLVRQQELQRDEKIEIINYALILLHFTNFYLNSQYSSELYSSIKHAHILVQFHYIVHVNTFLK